MPVHQPFFCSDKRYLSLRINFAEFSNGDLGFIILPTGEAITHTAVHLTAANSTERKMKR